MTRTLKPSKYTNAAPHTTHHLVQMKPRALPTIQVLREREPEDSLPRVLLEFKHFHLSNKSPAYIPFQFFAQHVVDGPGGHSRRTWLPSGAPSTTWTYNAS